MPSDTKIDTTPATNWPGCHPDTPTARADTAPTGTAAAPNNAFGVGPNTCTGRDTEATALTGR